MWARSGCRYRTRRTDGFDGPVDAQHYQCTGTPRRMRSSPSRNGVPGATLPRVALSDSWGLRAIGVPFKGAGCRLQVRRIQRSAGRIKSTQFPATSILSVPVGNIRTVNPKPSPYGVPLKCAFHVRRRLAGRSTLAGRQRKPGQGAWTRMDEHNPGAAVGTTVGPAENSGAAAGYPAPPEIGWRTPSSTRSIRSRSRDSDGNQASVTSRASWSTWTIWSGSGWT